MTEPQAHQQCSCSRYRQCAMHRDQMRAITRRPREQRREEKQNEAVTRGIEDLKRRYGGTR